MDEVTLTFAKVVKNREQIEDFWFRRVRALESRSSQRLARCDMQYLIETGRATEDVYAHLYEKPVSWAPFISAANKARHEDGDLTLHSQIYPTREEASAQDS